MGVSLEFDGRVILVCGVAKGGIGGATARRLSAAGAIVVGVDKTQEILDATIADIQSAGGRGFGIAADLLDPAQTDPIVDSVVQKFGRLDGIANVAGGTRADEWMPLEDTTTPMFRETLNLNLEYVFRICRDAARSMIRRNAPAPLVNVSSISALTSAPFHGPYGAAKSGIAALTRTMAFEWARYGIRANSVSPGAVPTDRVMSRVGTSPPPTGGTTEKPDIVMTTVDELANAILFLLSDLASGISGQNLVVDSGLSTKFSGGPRRLDAAKVHAAH
jgi:NAD(P)-dependent dehydrogenase (short-subunit alcohol dehydrogenase family)